MNSIATATVVMLFASWTSNVVAGQSQSGNISGTVEFYGSIVEPPCTPEIYPYQLKVSCERNGHSRITTVALNNATAQPLPYNLGRSQVRWLDRQHRLGILTLTYE